MIPLSINHFLFCLQRQIIFPSHSRLVCRVDKSKKVHYQSGSEPNNQVHTQYPHQSCRRQEDEESSILAGSPFHARFINLAQDLCPRIPTEENVFPADFGVLFRQCEEIGERVFLVEKVMDGFLHSLQFVCWSTLRRL